eukprot:TRINITY_DN14877_c0_g2_i1.p1 TRINITY_DN14877_c0_g2~~TRINITY_DN14877_c0_g2_i1.p1  ORF type:complete len:154 (+),score=4.22 TRINITY_DN14877_c0_g2_i1:237-698(+)
MQRCKWSLLLFRVGFFLSVDLANEAAVRSLMWATLTCMLRLAILPATAAYVIRPGTAIVVWFTAFLVIPLALMLYILKCGKTNLVWYFVWGWGAYLVPLVAMANIALQEEFGMMLRQMWDYFRTAWPTLIAEFTLSDVVISDMYFSLLSRRQV